RRRHTRCLSDWSSDVCSSDLHGPTWTNIGYLQTVETAKNHPHLKVKLGKNQGRGIASGFWFNIGGESSAACHVNEDGSVTIVEEIGRASCREREEGAAGGGAV